MYGETFPEYFTPVLDIYGAIWERERERESELQSIYALLNDIEMAECFFNHRI